MFRKGYQPINEVTPATLPSTSTSWFVGLTGGVVVAILLSVVLAIVFGVLTANLQNQLNTANANIASLEMFAIELAEMSDMNTTYEEITTGRCEVPKGCAADIYSGTFRLLSAHTGSFSTLVAEIGPFDTPEVKKKKDATLRHETSREEMIHDIAYRAPGQQMAIICTHGLSLFTFNTLGSGARLIPLTPGQLANFNLTGPNIGNGGVVITRDPNLPYQNILTTTNLNTNTFFFNWYPDYVPCAGDVFDLIAPTRFTISLNIPPFGSSKKRDTEPGPVQRKHKIHAGPDTTGRKVGR